MGEWQAKAIADRYISRGGGEVIPSVEQYSIDLCQLANFILWHEDRDMHGCVRRDEAFAAMCRLLNVEQHRIRDIIRPKD
jgi:hypothetical protein